MAKCLFVIFSEVDKASGCLLHLHFDNSIQNHIFYYFWPVPILSLSFNKRISITSFRIDHFNIFHSIGI